MTLFFKFVSTRTTETLIIFTLNLFIVVNSFDFSMHFNENQLDLFNNSYYSLIEFML